MVTPGYSGDIDFGDDASGGQYMLKSFAGISGRYSFAVHAGSTICPIFISSASMFAGTCAVAVVAANVSPSATTNAFFMRVPLPALKGLAYKTYVGRPFQGRR